MPAGATVFPVVPTLAAFVRALEKLGYAGIPTAGMPPRTQGSPSRRLFNILERASRDLVPDALPTASLSPGITDARFFRAKGATAYGWCPLVLTPELLATIHGHDERISVEDFKKAVSVTTDVVRQAAS